MWRNREPFVKGTRLHSKQASMLVVPYILKSITLAGHVKILKFIFVISVNIINQKQ